MAVKRYTRYTQSTIWMISQNGKIISYILRIKEKRLNEKKYAVNVIKDSTNFNFLNARYINPSP